ncbi:MAG: NADH-quinone oxidoreductase subunit K [Candidatus Micrarchaeota archaeon]|nr:NADH-quinone oxidoreductase subunit K [Candidatus Micrarchaeota archaeon]MDE1824299.1 NADH-quinone oxidoreductase subunit K [Candidatus Micrarchaeota archaeon]MDE1849754.1 NADH-quinone oxidoreductase subunit K [Candidatus Micrarchaeota archaeon]
MLYLGYIIGTCAALLGVSLAGIITDRHFVVIMLAVEVMLVASMIATVAFISYNEAPDPIGFVFLIALWAVAAAETIALVTFYIYMKYRGVDFDVTKLSRMKW